jgi:hypothetical protein
MRLALLLLLAAAPAGAEAALVGGSGLASAIGLAPQASAVWPYGTFHDLLWVMVYHRSWLGFLGESLAAIVARGLLGTGLTALAWPPEVPRPSLRRLAARNVAFAALAGALLSPWAALGVVASEVSVSWYTVGELLPLLIMAPVLQRGGIVPGWWRGLPPLGTVVLSLGNFLVLTAGSALLWSVPRAALLPAALLAGALNGLLWRWAVRLAVLRERVRLPRVPVAPIVIVAAAGLVFGLVAISERGLERPETREPPPIAALEANSPNHPAIFMAGYNSRYDGEPSGHTPPIVRFSYRGLDPAGRPLPYTAVATHQSLISSARLLAAQVDRVHRDTGQPVALIAESEGALVARYYLVTMAHPAVDRVAFVSPPIRAGRIYYPPRGVGSGWGVVAGWEMRGVFAALSATDGLPNSADEPFVRSLMANAPLFRGNRMLCPVRGVQSIAFLSTVDAVTVSPGVQPRIPVVEVPGLHGLVIDGPVAGQRLADFLARGQTRAHREWDYAAIQWAGAAWQAPSLPVQWNPVWRDAPGSSGGDFQPDVCPPA